ncbi:hypothetical protein, partial [Halomonas sp.]|uniref:hypothetical protein n=1 Tax=Halomonas sp. TaxID=1486246 RepID=UPI0025C40594
MARRWGILRHHEGYSTPILAGILGVPAGIVGLLIGDMWVKAESQRTEVTGENVENILFRARNTSIIQSRFLALCGSEPIRPCSLVTLVAKMTPCPKAGLS